MEGIFWMIMCIPLAYGLSRLQKEWFFQGMMLIIAGRYLTFASIYGMRMYWGLGALLGVRAYLLFSLRASDFTSARTGGGIIEITGIAFFLLYRMDQQKNLSH